MPKSWKWASVQVTVKLQTLRRNQKNKRLKSEPERRKNHCWNIALYEAYPISFHSEEVTVLFTDGMPVTIIVIRDEREDLPDSKL
jgi:hypothetical protein